MFFLSVNVACHKKPQEKVTVVNSMANISQSQSVGMKKYVQFNFFLSANVVCHRKPKGKVMKLSPHTEQCSCRQFLSGEELPEQVLYSTK